MTASRGNAVESVPVGAPRSSTMAFRAPASKAMRGETIAKQVTTFVRERFSHHASCLMLASMNDFVHGIMQKIILQCKSGILLFVGLLLRHSLTLAREANGGTTESLQDNRNSVPVDLVSPPAGIRGRLMYDGSMFCRVPERAGILPCLSQFRLATDGEARGSRPLCAICFIQGCHDHRVHVPLLSHSVHLD